MKTRLILFWWKTEKPLLYRLFSYSWKSLSLYNKIGLQIIMPNAPCLIISSATTSSTYPLFTNNIMLHVASPAWLFIIRAVCFENIHVVAAWKQRTHQREDFVVDTLHGAREKQRWMCDNGKKLYIGCSFNWWTLWVDTSCSYQHFACIRAEMIIYVSMKIIGLAILWLLS